MNKYYSRVSKLCDDTELGLNNHVRYLAIRFINKLEVDTIDYINPTGESLLFEFFFNEITCAVDIYSDGEVVYVYKPNLGTSYVLSVFNEDIDEFAELINNIALQNKKTDIELINSVAEEIVNFKKKRKISLWEKLEFAWRHTE